MTIVRTSSSSTTVHSTRTGHGHGGSVVPETVVRIETDVYSSDDNRLVPHGQVEAARSIGLTFGQILRHVVLPQSFRSSVGPLAVLLNATYRNVAVAGIIGVLEFVKAGRNAGEATARPFPFFIAQFAVFIVLGLATGFGAQRLNERLAIRR